MGKKQHQKDKMYLTTTEWSTLYGGKKADVPGGRQTNPVSFLDQFSLLAEFDSRVRLEAVACIVELVFEHSSGGDGTREDRHVEAEKLKVNVGDRRQYTLKRLLRGLASSNKCARIGYSAALTELLRRVHYTPEEIIESMNKWLCLQTKEDKAQIFIGRLLAWGALIRARRVAPLLAECTDDMLSMGEKEFLESIVCHLFAELVLSIDKDKFEQVAWPVIQRRLTGNSEDLKPLDVYLMILVRQHCPALAGEVTSKKLLQQDTMCSVLQKSTSQLPQIHPVVPIMVEEASNNDQLDEFWSTVVGQLSTAPTAEKHFLLLHMLKSAFVQFDSLDFLMKETYVDQLVYPLVKTGSPLYAQARSLVTTLEGLADKKAKDILRFVLSHSKGYRFDHMTKSSLVAKTLQKAQPDVVRWYSKKLQKRLAGLQGINGEHQPDEGHLKFDIIIMEQLANLTHMANMLNQPDFKRHICEYISVTYFSGDARISKKPNIQALLKALAPSGKTNSLAEAADNIAAVLHIYLNMDNRHASFRHEKKLRSANKLMLKLNKCNKEADTCVAFRILVGYLSLSYALDIQQDVTVLDDLMSSAKAFLNGPQEADEVEWIDLVMEALVAALSVENNHFRSMIMAALALLHKDITTDSLAILLGVFKGNEELEDLTKLEELTSGEEDLDDYDDDDDSEEKEDHEAETNRNAAEEKENESGSEIDFGDVILRNQLSTVLGVAGSDDSESEVEATDEEMMKLDKAISAAFGARFRSLSSANKKESKKKELQALHFEMKCLHILDSYVKSNNVSLSHIILICRTLLVFATSKRAKNVHRPIVSHIAETLRDVSSLKMGTLCTDEASVDEIKEFGTLIAEKIRTVYEPELRVALNSLLPFVVKCVKIRNDDEEWYFGIYRDLIQTYIEQQMTPVAPPVFVRFVEVFNEHCLVMVDVIETVLVDCCVQKRDKRVQLMGLLVAALKLCNPANIEKKRLKKSMKKLAAAISGLLERREELAFTTNLYVEFLDLMRLISKKCQEAELEDPMPSHSSLLRAMFKDLSNKNMPSKVKRRLNGVYRQFFPGEHFQLNKKQGKKTKKEADKAGNDNDQCISATKKRKINGHSYTNNGRDDVNGEEPGEEEEGGLDMEQEEEEEVEQTEEMEE
ncbi:DNA polymerase V-like isoform X1 [Varroa jacobsoni]|uniref:DNA polymerase V-like isoform X1 n=1 Tax=Varroa jacobsoni TaxID=62625 RepID=UPI000BF749AB|nr:DNA polymerase V-like isoform X1 [Varroa jacobsoni]